MLKENDIFRDKLNITKWHEKGFTGKGVNIVVLDDNGLIREHSKDKVIEPFQDSYNKVNHKTNVVDTILEFAPEAKIFAFNWFTDNKLDIIRWLAENRENIDIINCSFSTDMPKDYILHENIVGLKIPCICSSGNRGKEKLEFPASHQKSISVGSLNINNKRRREESNWRCDLDAVSYSHITIQGANKFDFGGTSCATAVLTGTISLLLQYYKEKGIKLSIEQLRRLIHKYSRLDLVHEDNRNQVGKGLFVLPDIEDLKDDDFMPEETFKDVKPNDWFHKAVKWAKEKGHIKGV